MTMNVEEACAIVDKDDKLILRNSWYEALRVLRQAVAEAQESDAQWQEIAGMVQEALTAAGQRGNATPPMNFNDAIRILARERDEARQALAEAQAEIRKFRGALAMETADTIQAKDERDAAMKVVEAARTHVGDYKFVPFSQMLPEFRCYANTGDALAAALAALDKGEQA